MNLEFAYNHRFTQSAPDIEESIHADMAYAVDILKKQVGDIISIYISGSFGRGDGMVFMYNNIRIINDYDFLVITKNRQKEERTKAAHVLMKKFGFHVSVACIYPDLTNLNLTTQNDIDIVYGSKCIWGVDVFNTISVSPDQIDKKDAVKLLFSRLDTIFEFYVPRTFNNNNISSNIEKIELAYNIIKAQRHLLDAWCIYYTVYDTLSLSKDKKNSLDEILETQLVAKVIFQSIDLMIIDSEPVVIAESSDLKKYMNKVLLDILSSIDFMDKNICNREKQIKHRFGYLLNASVSFLKTPRFYFKNNQKRKHLIELYSRAEKMTNECS